MELVAVDIGGTHARFALAEVDGSRVTALGEPVTLKTADHRGLEDAWEAFARQQARALPRAAAIAVACPIAGEVLKLTNNPWVIRPAGLAAALGVERVTLVNDFEAVGHAVATMEPEHLRHLCGPDRAFADDELISIIGPGTGLGVVQVLCRDGRSDVIPCEGGHIGFAPLDPLEDAILARLRERHGRVSAERIVAGPGLVPIYEALGGTASLDDKALWTLALSGTDSLAAAAFERFCMSLGSVAGDIVLAQGATALVIAGGLGLKLADHLPRSGFGERFTAKGRMEARMAAIPVSICTHPQPGLHGAAAAFAKEHRP